MKLPKIKLMFAWYDVWVGGFWDRVKRKLYIFPVPCVGVCIEFARPLHDKCPNCGHMTTLQPTKSERHKIPGDRYECFNCSWTGEYLP